MEILILYLECTASSLLGAGFTLFVSMNMASKGAFKKGVEFKSSDYFKTEKFAIYANLCVQAIAILCMNQAIQNYPSIEKHLIILNALIGAAGTFAFSALIGKFKLHVTKMVEEKESAKKEELVN